MSSNFAPIQFPKIRIIAQHRYNFMDHKIRIIILLLLSMLIYGFSLFYPGYCDDRTVCDNNMGVFLVIFGWAAALEGGAAMVWFANPLLWIAWITIRRPMRSLNWSIAATALALAFLLFKTIKNGGICGGTDYQSSSCPVEIVSYGAGYFLWVASAAIMLVGNLIRVLTRGTG